jgi:hypothetical protein
MHYVHTLHELASAEIVKCGVEPTLCAHLLIISPVYHTADTANKYCRRFMDPLSISAAVAGFLSLAGQIAATLKDYIDGVQSAPDEVRSLHLEVTVLCQVLKDLVGFLHKDDLNGRRFESYSVLRIAIKACQCQLEELHGKLANLSVACSSKKLPGWVERMK